MRKNQSNVHTLKCIKLDKIKVTIINKIKFIASSYKKIYNKMVNILSGT